MGSSGRGFSKVDPADVYRRIRREQAKSRDEELGLKVSGFLSSLLADYNARDTEATSTHLETIKSALKDKLSTTIDVRFGGSVEKHTYVDGLSDVDALLLLPAADALSQTPKSILAQFRDALQARLPQTKVKAGRLAITVHFSDGPCIQLLPAARAGRGFRIPAADGRTWSRINPQTFARQLTAANLRCGGKLVPTVKLAKAIMARIADTLPKGVNLTGYHAEALAVRAFQSYKGQQTPREMLKHFFTQAAGLVRHPITDSSGQSIHVDDHLGAPDSPSRLALHRALDRTARRIKNADAKPSLAQWHDLLGVVS